MHGGISSSNLKLFVNIKIFGIDGDDWELTFPNIVTGLTENL